jgi:hypothetical protein
MIRALRIAAQVIWAVSLVAAGTLIGAAHGWAYHGWLGAIVLGTIGFGVGALLASSPLAFLEILSSGL